MSTNIYQKGLQLFLEANELSGANGSTVASFTDLSVKGRNLIASSSLPTLKTNAVNGKKSVVWNGAKNPLKYTGSFVFNCGFLVLKQVGVFENTYAGIISELTNLGILTGLGGTNQFYDFQYKFPAGNSSFEYRVNDRIYPSSAATLPVDEFVIVFFRFWQKILVDGIQLGQGERIKQSKM